MALNRMEIEELREAKTRMSSIIEWTNSGTNDQNDNVVINLE
jgi:hypothetical protein